MSQMFLHGINVLPDAPATPQFLRRSLAMAFASHDFFFVCVCVSVVPLGLQIVLRVAREEQTGTGAEAETRGGSKKGAREWKVLGLVGGDLAPFAGNVNSIAMRPSTQSFVLLGLQMVLRVAREEQAGAGAEEETREGSGKEEGNGRFWVWLGEIWHSL